MQRLRNELRIDLHVLGIVSSRAMFLYKEKGCDLETWQTDVAISVSVCRVTAYLWHQLQTRCLPLQGVPPSLDEFTEFFSSIAMSGHCHTAIIDCTADAQVPQQYSKWLGMGIHIITPNKKLCSGPMADWTAVRESTKALGTQFMYEVAAQCTCNAFTWHGMPC